MDVNNNNFLNSIVKNHYPSFTDLEKLENGNINKNEVSQDLEKEEVLKYIRDNDNISLINNKDKNSLICINSKKICFTIIFLCLSFMTIIILSLFY